MATAYTNPGGTTYRKRYITVTTSPTISGGRDATLLVDGVINTGGYYFANCAAANETIQFDFGESVIIDEAKYYQQNTTSHGVWQWQGSANGSDWTSIGGTFTLGGITTQTQTSLNGNTTAYRYYRLLGVSGNALDDSYNYEFEFKIEFGGTGASYYRTFGFGDRTATIADASDLSYTGAYSILINGFESSGLYFSGQACAGKYISYDFGAGTILVEALWIQSTTGNHGTWRWQGSANGTDWTNIGNTFTLGGALAQAQTELSGNTTAYQHYRLLGVSGNTSNGPWLYEINFKINVVSAASVRLAMFLR